MPVSGNELPADGDWAAVNAAVHRLAGPGMSVARLSRESGVSETTIRYLGQPAKRQRSTLVALSAALGCRPGYLADVLYGRARDSDAGARPPCPAEARLAAIEAAVAGIRDMLHRIGSQLD